LTQKSIDCVTIRVLLELLVNNRDGQTAAKIARRLINRLIHRTCVVKLH